MGDTCFFKDACRHPLGLPPPRPRQLSPHGRRHGRRANEAAKRGHGTRCSAIERGNAAEERPVEGRRGHRRLVVVESGSTLPVSAVSAALAVGLLRCRSRV